MPRISTLSLYIGMRFLLAIFAVFGLCTVLIFMIDFVEMLRQAGKYGSVPGWLLAWITVLRLPAYTEILLPFAVLVGSIGALLMLARKSELAVMRAGGMSVWQFLRPGITVALLLGIFSTTTFNPLAARARDQAERLYAEAFGRESSGLNQGAAGPWLRQDGLDGQSILSAASAQRRGTELTSVTAFVYDKKGSFVERIDAKQAHLEEGFWVLKDAVVSAVGREPETFGSYLLSTYLTRERAADAFGTLISVSFWELPDLIYIAEKAGLSSSALRTQYELLLTRPLLCIAMVFLAATVSLRSFRSGGIQTMVVTGMVGGFGFFLFAEISRQVGTAGLAPVWAAVWVPVLLAILCSVTVLLHQEDG
ncbi:LPS export ABC transporter permease LptG [Hyphomicrobium sp.]|uniref:LPS export ABC transporter permease LptG n=1 Tax=Hyphomicrobium sp. TaxID=82 RepID=UPI0025C6EA0D|nr:LPS export ABC transporter permease LptG [Hyphomicrobium sp.]MCC7250744.1 LPS export ABC transporter permease LptG [Hyphomicrobium sp.]